MTQDEELDMLLTRVRWWHMSALRGHREEGLPEYEYGLAMRCYRPYLRRAIQYRKEADLRALRDLVNSLLYFVNPWPVTTWYAINKKKQKV